MAKVKGNKTKLGATATTPLKAANGKVRKVCVKVKNLKLKIKHNENDSSTKPINTEDLKITRLCYVKLRRTHINDSMVSQNINNTLQAQCKVNNKGNNANTILNIDQIVDKLLISPSKSGNNVRQNVVETKKSRAKKCTIDLPGIHKNDVKKVGGTNKKQIRRCVVKKTLPVNDKNNIIRKCQIPETSIPNCTTTCLVRLKRIPKISCDDELIKTTIEAVNLTPNDPQTVVPILDKIKRNNFQKLSLNTSKNGKVKTPSKSEKYIIENEKKSEITSEMQSHTTTNNITKNNTESQTSELQRNYKERNTLAKTTLVQKNHSTKFQHVLNLSLERNKPLENKNLEITQFEPQQNSTICFAPVRNSTLIYVTNDKNKETIITEDNKKDQEKGQETEKSNSNNRSPSQNFANKSQEIEKILDSLDDDDVGADTDDNINNKKENVNDNRIKESPIVNKTNKFFHRQDKNLQEEIHIMERKKSPSKKKSSIRKHLRITKRSSLAKRDKIYEFLSQSQTSDSDSNKHLDPAADIIKKLIAQGKVRVATTCKGKGRPIFKRNVRIKQCVKKVKLTAAKKGKKDCQKNPKVDDHSDLDEHFIDNFDHDEPSHEMNNNNNMEQQHQDARVNTFYKDHQHHISDHEGTFSRLARSVLINQAGRSDLQRQKAQLLLEMAKKYVSTPKNKKMPLPQEALHSNLSPIAMPSPRPAGNASPWRVDEEAHLPKVFNFNRSSRNLPSFSSDFIPSTPRKEKPKNKSIHKSPLPGIDNQSLIPSLQPQVLYPIPSNENCIADSTPQATNEQSTLSSFSSNDSNAENMPPLKAAHVNRNNYDNIFDLRQYPNPKRTLNYRSPLKAINILEVVYLTPGKHPSKTPHANDLETDNEEMFGFEEDLNDDSLDIVRSSNDQLPQENHCTQSKKNHTEDLFGFEDFLTQTDLSSQELCDDVDAINHINKSIHDKLQDLRKLRPEGNELQFNLLKEKTKNALKNKALFEEGVSGETVDVNGMRQRGIKEMLCSTMIQSPQASTSKAALEQLKKRNQRYTQKPNFVEDSNISELFKDPEPEVTFNENDAHRTYVRPCKRKRRLKENKFVMFLESDESGDEEDSAELNKHHHSHETDTSSEKAPKKKKRKRKEANEKPEMTEFIHDFNEMCKEVDSYELIVERSA